MASKFGLTWWGKEWLRSLDNIDYENRIPRGRTYANTGKVVKIKIKDNIITASVAGSRRTPYKVMIVVPPFFDEEVTSLIDAIVDRPLVLGKLLNRELDPAVLDIATECGLKVFPSQWTDIKLQCSCPDWAVPCKHLAAVIYMLSREIDNNPFLVFTMHRVDLLAELEKRGYALNKTETIDVPDYVSTVPVQLKDEALAADTEAVAPVVAKRIDYSRLTDVGGLLLAMLQASPSFYDRGDFLDVYGDRLRILSKHMERVLEGKQPLMAVDDDTPSMITRHTALRLVVHPSLASHMVLVDTATGDETTATLPQVMACLQQIHNDFLDDYQPSVQAFYAAQLAALHLLRCRAVVPAVVLVDKKTHHCAIDWQPAMLDVQVAQVVTQVGSLFAAGDVVLSLPKRRRPLLPAMPAVLAVSQLLRELVSKYARVDLFVSEVARMFFGCVPMDCGRVGRQELPGAIKAWLAPYGVGQGGDIPLLVVSEKGEGFFDMDVRVECPVDGTITTISLPELADEARWADRRLDVYKKLSLLAALVPELSPFINSMGEHPIEMGLQAMAQFLLKAMPAVRMMGVRVLLPKSLQQLMRPKVSGVFSTIDNNSPKFCRIDEVLRFDWRVALGDEVISRDEFERLASNASGLIVYKGRYFFVDQRDVQLLAKQLDNAKTLSAAQMLQTAISGTLADAPVVFTHDAEELIGELKRPIEVAVPSTVKARLRPYQERGYAWMYRNLRLGFGSIIADDMGLGKTLQVITLIDKLRRDGELKKHHVLIVVPTGLISNWVQELQRFAPSVTAFVYHGPSRSLESFSHDVLITSYGVMRGDVDKLNSVKWRLMVIDEAQNIKNSTTGQATAARKIKAQNFIAMSGTPVENRLAEFWSIMDFVNKGFLGTRKQFETEYAKPIQLWGDADKAERFRSITAPFMMRRLKTDRNIISDLPDKVEQNDYAPLTPAQAALYEGTLREGLAAIEGMDGTSPQQLFKRQGMLLQMMLFLKQICNHPAQFLKTGGHEASLSGKAMMLLDLAESIVQSGEKALIFTQFTEMGTLLQEMLEKRVGTRPMFYHGGCSLKERNAIVSRFQNNRADQLLILSLKAAGTGLNLTAASHVIHYDLWWNPAVEAQATDRAYRIGQNKNVQVHRFITQGTFEERIDNMIQSKKHLADLTVTAGESWIGHLSNKEIHEIFDR